MSYRGAYGYTHIQATPSTTWTITHNFNSQTLVVDCFIDNSGVFEKAMPASVVATSAAVITVTWSTARAGKAFVV